MFRRPRLLRHGLPFLNRNIVRYGSAVDSQSPQECMKPPLLLWLRAAAVGGVDLAALAVVGLMEQLAAPALGQP